MPFMVGQFVRSILNPIVRIKKEEWPKTLLMFLYFFLTITSYYILKPVRDSVFIDTYGAENLPYVWLITIVVLTAVVYVYVKFADILPKNILLSSTVIFFVSNLMVFWWLSHLPHRWVAAVFFVWVSIFSVMAVTQFWLYANDLFNPREAKRLFGFVGSGGILGGITGGLITHSLATTVGTRNLLLVAAFILAFCAILINIIWELERERAFFTTERTMASRVERPKATREVLRLIWKKRYLLLLVGLVCIAKIVSTLVDYQFKNIVQASITGLDARTAFFGEFFAWLNTVSFSVQFFLTSFVLRRFGVGFALFLLPIGLTFGSVAILAQPALWSAVFTMLYDGSMNYSLNQSTKEVLYLPIFSDVRYRVKPFIDMVGYRIAKGLGSVLILVVVNILHLSVRSLSAAALVLIVFWLMMIYVMRREYVNALREFLKTDLPEEHERVIARSEAWLLYGIMRKVSRGSEKDLHLAIRLYNLGLEPAVLNQLMAQAHESPDQARAALTGWMQASQPDSLRREIRRFLTARSLEEAGCALRFFADFREGRGGEWEGHLKSPDPCVRLACACGMLLAGTGGDVPALALKIDTAAREILQPDFAGLAARMDLGVPEVPLPRETAVQVFQWLSQDLAHQKAVLEEVRSTPDLGNVFSVLRRAVEEKGLPAIYRRNIPVLLAACGTQEVIPLLYQMLSQEDSVTRDQAIHALAEVRLRSPERMFERKPIEKEIEQEIEQAHQFQALIRFYQQSGGSPEEDHSADEDPFVAAQERRFHEAVSRIFLLLSILGEPQDIRTIYHSLNHPSEHVKANALELLENVIDQPKLRRDLVRLVEAEFHAREDRGLGVLLAKWNGSEAERSLSRDSLFTAEESWSFLSLVYLAAARRGEGLQEKLRALRGSSKELVRELASLVCESVTT